MAYTIPAIAGESPVEWNGTTYYPVTDWSVSANSGGGESWLHAAVRFLMAEGATETSFHIVAQYATYTTTGSVPNTTHTRNAMLIQRLNTAPTTGVNQAGAEYTGSNAVGKFFTALDTNQRTGYPASATVTNNIVWYGQPYIVTDLGTVGAGVTLTSKTFYSTMSDVPSSAVSITGTYTTPLETYAITYKSNYTGGAADIVATKVKNTDITISACEFTRTDYHFLHWNTNSGDTGTVYNPSDTYATNAALTLYAIWEPDHVAPYFTNTPTVTRCDSSGVASDEGTGLKVSFTYGKDSASTWTGITKKVEYKLTSASTWTQALSSADNDSGTYNKYTASITLDQSKAYNIRITLSETFQSKTYSTSFTSFISTTSFGIDMYGDNSVAVGSSAPESIVTDFAGALTLGGAWDEQMILDSTNGVDANLASAILAAGYTGVYNTTNLLSLKKLLSQVIASTSGSGIKGTSEFIVGTQGSSTNAWTGVSEQAALTDGMQITYFLPYATNSSNATLNLTMGDGSTTTGAIPIYRYGTTRLASATYAPANSVIHMTYRLAANAWYMDVDANSTYTVYNTMTMTAGASTQAKVADTNNSNYKLKAGNLFPLYWMNANTYNGKLTLNIAGTGAKTLYINGVVSSSSNKTVAAGVYQCYYDGTYYYINSDGSIPHQALTKATSSTVGAVKPDGTSTSVDANGVISAVGTTYDLTAALSSHTWTATLAGSDGSSDAASFTLAAGSNVQLADSGTTVTISATDTTYSDATQSTHGLMSAADKTKLDGIEAGAKASMSGSYTPAGTVSQPTFTGDSMTSTGSFKPEGSITITQKNTGTANYTPAGTVSQPSFTGTAGSVSVTGTPSGSVSISTASTGTANYTPAGTVSQPTFTGTSFTSTGSYKPEGTVSTPTISVKTAGSTTSVNSMTGQGTLPTLSITVSGEKLTFTLNQGTLPTYAAVTVKNGDAAYQSTQPTFSGTSKSVSVSGTATGSVSQPTFSGTGVVLTASFSGSSTTSTGTFTPSGTVSQPSFTGTGAVLEGTFSGTSKTVSVTGTPSGTVSQPTFTGTAATINVS